MFFLKKFVREFPRERETSAMFMRVFTATPIKGASHAASVTIESSL